MNLSIWVAWPTVNIQRSRLMTEVWHERGYKVAVLINPPHEHTDLPEADRVIVQEEWEGFATAGNLLCHEVPADIVVIVGDDIFPDPDRTAQEIGQEFLERFPDLFGVMQPIGDVYGWTHRCCVSPWVGRKFIEDTYNGEGPYWPEYFHYFNDYELQLVAEKLGAFQQREDIVQFHDHWERKEGAHRPEYLRKAKRNHPKDKRLWKIRSQQGYPGL